MEQSLSASSPLLQRYYPGLDGLRGLAFLLVFGFHYGPLASAWIGFQWGFVGVDIFFVLSGFLITGILYDTAQRRHFFRDFYTRRTLRIFPLFYGLWLFLLLLTPFAHFLWNRYTVYGILYLGNLYMPGAVLGLHPNPYLPLYHSFHHPVYEFIDIGHLWSLCVEEQFYLVWPLVVWLIRSRRALLIFCLTWIVASPLVRGLYLHAHALISHVLYYNTLSRVEALLWGAALALFLRGPALPIVTLRRIALAGLPLALTLLALGMHRFAPGALDPGFTAFVSVAGFSLIAMAAMCLLFLVIDDRLFLIRLLKTRPLSYLGRISYGLYVFHLLPYRLVTGRLSHRPSEVRVAATLLAVFAITFVAAALSFKFYEAPFIRLKDKLTRPDPSPVGA